MALSQDQINFIVSVSTSTAQKELNKFGEYINDLTELNKEYRKEIKSANSELKSLDSQMTKCAKTAGENSQQYSQLKEQYTACARKIADYTATIKNNEESISGLKQSSRDMLMTMDNSQLTMAQLTNKSKILQAQLKNTAYEADPKQYAALQKQLTSVGTAMQGAKIKGQGLGGIFTAMPGPVGVAAKSIQGFGQGFAALFSAGPLGIAVAVITAVVAAFKFLKNAINSNEEATNKFSQIAAPFKVLWEALTKVIGKAFEVVADGILWLEKLGAAIISIIPGLGKVNKANQEAIDLEKRKQNVLKDERSNIVSTAKTEKEVSELRAKYADKEHTTASERLALMQQAGDLEKKQLAINLKIAKEKLAIAKIDAQRAGNSKESLDKIAQLEADVLNAEKDYNEKDRTLKKDAQQARQDMISEAQEAARKYVENQKNNIEEITKNLEKAHNIRVAAIKTYNADYVSLEASKQLNVIKEDKVYHEQLLKEYESYLKKVRDKQLRSDLKDKIAEEQQKIADDQRTIDETKIQGIQEKNKEYLDIIQTTYDNQKAKMQSQLNSSQISQEDYDAAMILLDQKMADDRLNIAANLATELQKVEVKNSDVKVKAVKEANAAMIKADNEAELARTAVIKSHSDAVKAALEAEQEFILNNKKMTVQEEQEIELKSLEAVYKEKKAQMEKEHLDTTALTQAYDSAINSIHLKYDQEHFATRQALGLTSMAEEYKQQETQLTELHNQGKLSEEEYQESMLDLKVSKIKAYFDMFAQLASSAVQSMQEAEIAQVDAKYDVLLKAAEGNTEQTEKLEKEKEKEKLKIQKKYADVNFAIKASQIIADTAVSIMKVAGQAGMYAGPIQAMMAVMGAAQLAIALAERNKIKNMQISDSGSSSSSTALNRVVTGAEEGGYVEVERAQDGKHFLAKQRGGDRGYMDSPTLLVGENGKEFVANAATVSNPTIRPLLDIINDAQQRGYSGQLNLSAVKPAAAYAAGGYTSSNFPSSYTQPAQLQYNKNTDIEQKLLSLLEKFDANGLKAFIVLSELQKQQELQAESDKYASKN